jgi:hypothetical protein
VDGQKIGIRNNIMPKKGSDKNFKLKKIVKILKFLLTIDDEEVTKSSIESIIEMLEEEINQS